VNSRKNAWLTGVVALVTTLLVLFGGQTIWHTFAVAKPLDKAFDGIDGVQSVAWDKEKDDKAVVLRVTLGHTTNLQTTYTTVQERAKSVLGKSAFQISLQDSRTPELEQFYHDLHFHIEEAIVTGRFGDMADKINDKAKTTGVEAHVYVDAQNVYLQLTQGESELYTVTPRVNNNLTGVK
jgi:hypothetical protein